MKSVVASSRSNGSNVTVSTLSQANTGLTEHDYIGLSEVSSSSQTSEYSHRPNEKEAQEADGGFGETELKLGLSLTASGSYSKDAPALGFSNAEKTFQWVCSQDNGVEQEKSSYPPVKGSEKRVSQEEYQRASVQGGWPRGFEQWISQDRACSVWQNQVLRAREGARILTAQDLQAPAPLPSSMGQDVVEGLRSGFGFSNSGRVIIPPMAGTKRVHNDSVGSEGLQDSSAIPKGQVVGWPPIKQYRSKTLASPPKPPGDDQEDVIQASKSVQNQGNSLYVKVNMDGVPIGRKVDLNAHDSYETLALALEDMFQRSNNNSEYLPSISSSVLFEDLSDVLWAHSVVINFQVKVELMLP
eukprot:Gb_22660 [translate_table: standard]